MMKVFPAFLLCLFLLSCSVSAPGSGQSVVSTSQGLSSQHTPQRALAAAVVVSDRDPYFSIISTSIACWYESETNVSVILPLLVHEKGTLTAAQMRFLGTFLNSSENDLLVLGDALETPYGAIEILGEAPAVAVSLATWAYITAPDVLVVPYGDVDSYQLSLLAAPLASYLNMPILLFDDNEQTLRNVCEQLQTNHVYLVGDVVFSLPNATVTPLPDEAAITEALLTVISDMFGSVNYLTMANPADVIPPQIHNTTTMTYTQHIINKKIIILGKEFDIAGNDSMTLSFPVSSGFSQVEITAEIVPNHVAFLRRFSPVDPIVFLTLTDPAGRIVAYGNSMGYAVGKTMVQTLSCNNSGFYDLKATAYQGLKGGFFVHRGLSWIDANLTFTITRSLLSTPHVPQIQGLSRLAPYLTAVHGGLLIANSTWELTDASYGVAAQGSSCGPWYNASLHSFTNAKVNKTIEQVQETLEQFDSHGLLSGYLNGPAWLALLADTTMIPMYYYGPSQEDIPDRGLPSDNPYTLNQSLSVGRIIGWDVQDVSVLLARTFFYERVCGEPEEAGDWHSSFHFMFGEGYSETGGLFHQVPYAREIRTYGFTSKVYGDLRNSRQIAERLGIFTTANYLEYLGHGDWFWFPASLYGLDSYSKAFDVAHVKDWVFDKPSIFLSAACLMGRTDGLSPQMNIGLALLHAGCNGFIGATRETGQESGLTVLENHLIVDDWSLGEALRGEKQIDTELPTFYVRVLYGDPAFNPYEPLHGFNNQGRPVLLSQ
jgi:hypothetical protein